MGLKYELQPDIVVRTSGFWIPTSTSALLSNLSDASDSTYVYRYSYGGAGFVVGVENLPALPAALTRTVTAASWTGGVATLTTSVAHGFTAGTVIVVDCGQEEVDGVWIVATASGSTLTFSGAGGTSGSAGGLSGTVRQMSEVPCWGRARWRWASTTGAVGPICVSQVRLEAGGASFGLHRVVGAPGSPESVTMPWQASAGEQAWSTALVNGTTVHYEDSNYTTTAGAVHRVYDVWLDVQCETVPIVDVTGPSGTVTDTTTPTVSWDLWDDPTRTNPVTTELRVFAEPAGGWSGFDPEVEVPVEQVLFANTPPGSVAAAGWGDGWGPTNARQHILATDLTNGVEYRFYMRAVKNPNAYSVLASPWTYSTATLDLLEPQAPTLDGPAWQDEGQSVLLSVLGHVNMLSENAAGFVSGEGGWGVSAGTALLSATYAAHGQYSLALAVTAGARTAEPGPLDVSPGVRYGGLLSGRSPAGNRTVTLALRWFTAADAYISESTATFVAGSSGWTAGSVYGVAPPTAAKVRLRASWTATGSETLYVDDALVAPAESGVVLSWSPGVDGQASFVVERSVEGAEWEAITRIADGDSIASGKWVPANIVQQVTVEDHEAPRGSAVSYRARAYTEMGGSEMASPWSEEGEVETGSDATWWVKHPYEPSWNVGEARILAGSIDGAVKESLTVSEPVGGTVHVVTGSGFLAMEGSFDWLAVGVDEGARVRRLMTYSGPLLVQDVLGGQTWVRFTDRSFQLEGTGAVPSWRWQGSWVEVEAP